MSNSDRLKREKRALRRRVRELRDALASTEREHRSAAIARELFALPEMAEASVVMAFSAFGSEVATDPILARLVADGHVPAVPRVREGEIEALPFRPGAAMRRAPFGANEPVASHPIPPANIDVVVTPGVAFDRHGFRVGYGGGYYDRFFLRTRPDVLKAAICFALQVVDEVPHGSQDVPVDVLITEEGVIRCG